MFKLFDMTKSSNIFLYILGAMEYQDSVTINDTIFEKKMCVAKIFKMDFSGERLQMRKSFKRL